MRLIKKKFNRILKGKAIGIVIGVAVGSTVAAAIGGLSMPQVNHDYDGTMTLQPFGNGAQQPPPKNISANWADEVGIKVDSSSICGFPNFSQTLVQTSTKLMSLDYWKGKGNVVLNQIKSQAESAIGSISGALPGIVARQLSPTYANLLDHNQIIGQWEGDLTVDTCKSLQNLADGVPLQQALAACISGKVKIGSSASEAREFCINSGASELNYNSDKNFAEQQVENVVKNTDKDKSLSFSNKDLFKEICPETNTNSTYSDYSTAKNSYSSMTDTCKWAEKSFQGVEIKEGKRIAKKGSFNNQVNALLAEEQKEISEDVLPVIKQMSKGILSGKNPQDTIKDSSSNWSHFSKSDKATNKKAPNYMQTNSDGSAPSFVITPSQMYQLAKIVSVNGADSDFKNEYSPLKQTLNQITKVAAYQKMLNQINDLRQRTDAVCSSSPKLQSDGGKENCELLSKKLSNDIQYLSLKSQLEREYITTQNEVSSFISQQTHKLRHNNAKGEASLENLDAPKPSMDPRKY